MSLLPWISPTQKAGKTFAQIYEDHKTLMRKVAYKLLHENTRFADDAVQDAFVNMSRNMNVLARMDDQAIRVYAIKAVTTSALKLLEQEGRYVPLDSETVDIPDGDNTVLDHVCFTETYQILLQAVRELPETYREVLRLHYLCQIDLPAIARMFGMKYDTVKKRFQRGRQMLMKKLEKEGITCEH